MSKEHHIVIAIVSEVLGKVFESENNKSEFYDTT